ncbi:MAG: HNH endonuclease [Kangiellaceae bacterium]|nr:HNH endonuclease [Kangiellaceae bacterium]
MSRPKEDIWLRIIDKVVPIPCVPLGGYCFSWTGAINESGYGRFNHNLNTKNLSTLIHRLVYQLLVDNIPSKIEVDHICKNRTCCNPNHLRLATKSENLKNRKFNRGS